MSVAHETQLPSDGKIWIRYKSADGRYGLLRSSTVFYNKSRYCQKMYVILPTTEIMKYEGTVRFSAELCKEKEHRVLLLPYPKASILRRRIKDFESMHRFMMMVEELQLDIGHIQDTVPLSGWLVELSIKFDGLLRANAKLFEAIDVDFAKMHLPAIQQPNNDDDDNQPQQNYDMPVAQPKELKPMIPFTDQAIPQNVFDRTVTLCMTNGLTSLAVRIISTFLKSMIMSHHALKFPGLANLFDSHSHELLQPMFIAWRTTYLLERQYRHLPEKTHPYLFTEKEIMGLPKMAVNGKNPYLIILNKEHISMHLQMISPVELPGARGVYPLKKFKDRVKLFTGGCLEKLDWTNTALCGSAIAACLIQNPLEACFETTEEFWEEYYPKNLRIKASEIAKGKQCLFYMEASDEAVSKPGQDQTWDGTDIDLMIQSPSLDEFDGIAKTHFVSIRDACPRQPINLVRVETPNKHKWRIEGLDRNIELFHVENIAAVIGKFHLGCVRAWYDGSHVWMFSSFLTAALTGINIDMRWVSCEKDLRDIILRYYQRGFCTILNKAERKNIAQYMRTSPKWPSPPIPNNWRWRRKGLSDLIRKVDNALFHPRTSGFGVWHGRPAQKSPSMVPVKITKNKRQLKTKWAPEFRTDKSGRFFPKFLQA